jgi:hypothetical protein
MGTKRFCSTQGVLTERVQCRLLGFCRPLPLCALLLRAAALIVMSARAKAFFAVVLARLHSYCLPVRAGVDEYAGSAGIRGGRHCLVREIAHKDARGVRALLIRYMTAEHEMRGAQKRHPSPNRCVRLNVTEKLSPARRLAETGCNKPKSVRVAIDVALVERMVSSQHQPALTHPAPKFSARPAPWRSPEWLGPPHTARRALLRHPWSDSSFCGARQPPAIAAVLTLGSNQNAVGGRQGKLRHGTPHADHSLSPVLSAAPACADEVCLLAGLCSHGQAHDQATSPTACSSATSAGVSSNVAQPRQRLFLPDQSKQV